MKRYIIIITVLFAGAFAFNSCDEKHTIYDGDAFVMFADTLSICPATQDGEGFPVYVATLNTRSYDRTYGIEVVSEASNAVYGYHYKLESQTVTIPAGQTFATFNVLPIYENIEDADSLGFQMNLLSALGDSWSEEGNTTKVLFQKVCPFDIYDFTGKCRVTSEFLNTYLGSYSRDITCDIVEGEENTLILRDMYQDGYDIKIRFDNSDQLNPKFIVDEGQKIGDTRDLISTPHGDNLLLVKEVPGLEPTVNICRKIADIPLILYVDNVGALGGYYNVVEWIDEY